VVRLLPAFRKGSSNGRSSGDLLDGTFGGDPELLSPSERRLLRLRYDLHDGPLQDVAALAADLRVLESELLSSVPVADAEKMQGSLADMGVRLQELETNLRELAREFEPTTMIETEFRDALRHEVDKARRRAGIVIDVYIRGEFDSLTASQRIATLRIVQESLANVCEHSGATRAEITVEETGHNIHVQITDDGSGFDVEKTRARARGRGRLGLLGMSERIALLGGTFEIDSVPGRGTTITLVLERWQPPKQEGDGRSPGIAPSPA